MLPMVCARRPDGWTDKIEIFQSSNLSRLCHRGSFSRTNLSARGPRSRSSGSGLVCGAKLTPADAPKSTKKNNTALNWAGKRRNPITLSYHRRAKKREPCGPRSSLLSLSNPLLNVHAIDGDCPAAFGTAYIRDYFFRLRIVRVRCSIRPAFHSRRRFGVTIGIQRIELAGNIQREGGGRACRFTPRCLLLLTVATGVDQLA